jgi:hypothetical protein
VARIAIAEVVGRFRLAVMPARPRVVLDENSQLSSLGASAKQRHGAIGRRSLFARSPPQPTANTEALPLAKAEALWSNVAAHAIDGYSKFQSLARADRPC